MKTNTFEWKFTHFTTHSFRRMRGSKNGNFYCYNNISVEEWRLPYTLWNRDRLNSIWIWMMVLLSHHTYRMYRLHWNCYFSVLHRCIPIRWLPSNYPLWESSLMTLYSVEKRHKSNQVIIRRFAHMFYCAYLPLNHGSFAVIASILQSRPAILWCASFSAHMGSHLCRWLNHLAQMNCYCWVEIHLVC